MMWQVITAGFVLGLISSLHCVGMCGPLALALPVHHMPRSKQVLAIVLYNSGRTITYSLMGLLFGLAGRTVYLAGFQRTFSILLGGLMLLFAIYYFVFKMTMRVKWAENINIAFHKLMSRYLRPANTAAFIFPGLMNGLLPCGMVYLAIAGALSTIQVSHSAWFMLFFGLGTWPAMLALGVFGFRIKLSARQQLKNAMPYIVTVMGVLLILRGMQLGIPFVSPVLPGPAGQAVSCH